MVDEVLSKALPTDSEPIPRYNIVAADGSVLYENVEVRLANEVLVTGTLFNKATMLDDNVATRYNVATPNNAFNALVNEWQVQVPALGWSSAPDSEGYYTQTIAVEGMKGVFKPCCVPEFTDAASANVITSAFGEIKRLITADNSITVKAMKKLTADLTLRLWGV